MIRLNNRERNLITEIIESLEYWKRHGETIINKEHIELLERILND